MLGFSKSKKIKMLKFFGMFFGIGGTVEILHLMECLKRGKNEKKKKITVFTPTYNRAYCLHKCYESMKRQTSKDFEWLIIDDGSSDGTDELVKGWMKEEKSFPIRYIYKKNGGMHTAYNVAYENIDTELAMNIDSDDYLTDTAIEDILNFWKKIKKRM